MFSSEGRAGRGIGAFEGRVGSVGLWKNLGQAAVVGRWDGRLCGTSVGREGVCEGSRVQ